MINGTRGRSLAAMPALATAIVGGADETQVSIAESTRNLGGGDLKLNFSRGLDMAFGCGGSGPPTGGAAVAPASSDVEPASSDVEPADEDMVSVEESERYS